MKMRSLLIAAVLAFMSITSAFGKSYDFQIQETKKAGPVELKAGKYSVSVQGETAVFKDSSKSYTAPAKLETGTTKFSETRVNSRAGQILFIELGGTKTRLAFE